MSQSSDYIIGGKGVGSGWHNFLRFASGEHPRSGETDQVNFRRLNLGMGIVLLLGIATAAIGLAPAGSLAQDIQIPSPAFTPVPTASPAPTPSGPTRGRRAKQQQPGGVPTPEASPSGTPEPPQFTTLDGIWEVELQPLGKRLANYTHLSINATGADLLGYYQGGGKNAPKYPMTGNFDGRLITLTVTMPDGTSASFNGYVENFADMVGIFRNGDKDPGTAFTAQHRKKVKAQ